MCRERAGRDVGETRRRRRHFQAFSCPQYQVVVECITVTLDEAIELVGRSRAAGKRIVFTNGVFDLLHAGHVRYLQQARSLGDVLIVGLNSDRSVRANKGPGRPITSAAERAEILEALTPVDAVVVFDAETPYDLIKALQPDVLVKGADWAEEA